MDESVRLARMEAKLDAVLDRLEARDRAQDKHNELFYMTRDKVNEMDARAKGGWFVITIIAGLVSAIVSFFGGKV